jgi:hypothetical protein
MSTPAPALESRAPDPAMQGEDLLWILAALCRGHRLAFDGALLRGRFPPPCRRSDLLEAAGALGLRAGVAHLGGLRLDRVPLPCVA